MSAAGGNAFGSDNTVSGINASAFGSGNVADGANSFAAGYNSQAIADDSVALGANAVADRGGTVTVGASGAERQIVNVADGTDDTDAVNLRQLDSAISAAGDGYVIRGTQTGVD
ncbi:hypothetical protein AB4084_32055, partial [Lysobacter sp. 2RAB21]